MNIYEILSRNMAHTQEYIVRYFIPLTLKCKRFNGPFTLIIDKEKIWENTFAFSKSIGECTPNFNSVYYLKRFFDEVDI